MATYKTPDVYVEEISIFPPSVAEVETAIPAFIGYTEKAKKIADNDLKLKPTKIRSMADFEFYFGAPKTLDFTVNIVQDSVKKTFSIQPITKPNLKYFLYYTLKMFYANGGGPCYIISVGDLSTAPAKGDSVSGLLGGLKALEKEDEPTLILCPDAITLSKEHYYDVINAALLQAKTLQDRFSIIDVHAEKTGDLRNKISSNLDELKYGAVYHPFLETSLIFNYTDDSVKIGTHKNENGNIWPAATSLVGKKISDSKIKPLNNSLYNDIKKELNKLTIILAPGGAVAGVYAKNDSTRGVWKAPANISLSNVVKPTTKITSKDQEDLNVDTTAGKSINAIRSFTGKGTLVWGARTLAGNDNEWRYISVRRFFNMVEDSVVITVRDDQAPSITQPANLAYEEGSTGNEIVWTVGDRFPSVYQVTLDGETYIGEGSWVNGTITVN
ncbi:MAG: phage tail sheath family protein, partial [Bacteroidetes bacterium]|nr:phage tail sheath family protein [Bacteroidota bacterium]